MSTDTTTTTTDADALADELLAIHDATADDNKVAAQVQQIETRPEDGGNDSAEVIELTVRLPHGLVETYRVEKPVPWDPRRFTFAAILEDKGLGPANVEALIGEDVYVERVDDDWRLVDPMRTPFLKEFATALVVSVPACTFVAGVAVGYVTTSLQEVAVVMGVVLIAIAAASKPFVKGVISE